MFKYFIVGSAEHFLAPFENSSPALRDVALWLVLLSVEATNSAYTVSFVALTPPQFFLSEKPAYKRILLSYFVALTCFLLIKRNVTNSQFMRTSEAGYSHVEIVIASSAKSEMKYFKPSKAKVIAVSSYG